MPLKTQTVFKEYSGGRHSIYLPKTFVVDSQFPFQPEDELEVVIDGDTLVVRKARRK